MHYFFGLTMHTTGFKLGLCLVFHCSHLPNFVLLHTKSLSYPFTCIFFEQKKGNKSLTELIIFFEKENQQRKNEKTQEIQDSSHFILERRNKQILQSVATTCIRQFREPFEFSIQFIRELCSSNKTIKKEFSLIKASEIDIIRTKKISACSGNK